MSDPGKVTCETHGHIWDQNGVCIFCGTKAPQTELGFKDGLVAALTYVADMTCINRNGDWEFKSGYDPQVVLDALAKIGGRQS